MSSQVRADIQGVTDAGLVRSQNEDSIGMGSSIDVAVLADGMGGHRGGQVASKLAVDTILEILPHLLEHPALGQTKTAFSAQCLAVKEAIEKANSAIYQAAQNNSQYAGMGTTVVVVLLHTNRVCIAHVGDSRLYRLRSGRMEQLTEDHSLVQELIKQGYYTAEEAKQASNRNIVTRALGIEPTVEVEIREELVLGDDVYLLCSDGLTDMVEDPEIEEIIRRHREHLDKALLELVHQAKVNGGLDNISAMLVKPVNILSTKQNWLSKFVAFMKG